MRYRAKEWERAIEAPLDRVRRIVVRSFFFLRSPPEPVGRGLVGFHVAVKRATGFLSLK